MMQGDDACKYLSPGFVFQIAIMRCLFSRFFSFAFASLFALQTPFAIF